MNVDYDLRNLSDTQLIDGLSGLVRRSNNCIAAMLAHLAEVDARKLYREAAVPSLFEYCTRRLYLAEGAAYKRILVARVARRFPIIFEMIADGRLHLSGVKLLAPRLSDDNHRELLAAATHQGCRAIEKLLAERFPQPDASSLVRALPRPAPRRVAPPVTEDPPPAPAAPAPVAPAPAASAPAASLAPKPQAGSVVPTSAKHYRVQFTADQALHDKLRRAQELLSHAVPGGDPAVIFGRALDVLITQLEKRKHGQTDAPRTPRPQHDPAQRSRHIPLAVRREVVQRDGGRCTFTDSEGRRCPERGLVELHHLHPWARGGTHTPEGLTLRCRAHNQLAAELDFGRDHIERAMQRRPPPARSP